MVSPEQAADEIDQKISGFDRQKREGLINRLKLFLVRESAMSDDHHPAAVALDAIESGETEAAVAYLEAEIERTRVAKTGTEDETVKAKLDVRQNDLERWKQNLI